MQRSVDKVMMWGLLFLLIECVLIITFRTTAALVALSLVLVLTTCLLVVFVL